MTLFFKKIRKCGFFAVTTVSVGSAITLVVLLIGGASFTVAIPWLVVGLLGVLIACILYPSPRMNGFEKAEGIYYNEDNPSPADLCALDSLAYPIEMRTQEQESKSMSHTFFKGVAVVGVTATVAAGAIAYAKGAITVGGIKSTAVLLAGSASFTAVSPWLAVGLVCALVAAVAYYCWQRRSSSNNVLNWDGQDLLADDPDGDDQGVKYYVRQRSCCPWV